MDPLVLGHIDIIRQLAWLREQPPAQREALIAVARVRRLPVDAWAHGEGDEETGVLAVLDGALRLYAQAPGGREALIGLLGPGAAIGQSAIFGGGPRLVTAVCAFPSLVLTLSDSALRRVAEAHPALWRDLSRLIYRQLQVSIQSTAERLVLPPKAQLAARLLLMAREGGVRISQSDLAEMLGVSRKAVNGWLGELAREGAVRVGYGRIEIVSLILLERAVEAAEAVR